MAAWNTTAAEASIQNGEFQGHRGKPCVEKRVLMTKGESSAMQTTEAILLRKIRFGDTSLIVTWLGKETGKVRTMAKGATRPKSPFAGRLDLFFTAEIQYVENRKSELQTLREVKVTSTRDGLRTRYVNVQMGAYFVELIESALEIGEPVPEVYDLATRAFDYLVGNPATLRALLHFEKELARMLGVFDESGRTEPVAALAEVCGRIPVSRLECVRNLSG